jgi:hypothetical protein
MWTEEPLVYTRPGLPGERQASEAEALIDVETGPAKSEYCPACAHPFLILDRHGHDLTHHVDAEGNGVCRRCTAARPCRSTLVAGTGGFRFARDRLDDKPTHRGLNRDGPVH